MKRPACETPRRMSTRDAVETAIDLRKGKGTWEELVARVIRERTPCGNPKKSRQR